LIKGPRNNADALAFNQHFAYCVVVQPKKIAMKKGPLARRQTRAGTFVASIFMAVFWNGIVSVFLWQLISGAIKGPVAIGMGLFLTPFVLIGLALLFAVGYSFLSLFNPSLEVTLDSHDIRLGDNISGKWRIGGGASRIKKFNVVLEGSERVVYAQGTSTKTDTSLFFQQIIFQTTTQREIERGSFEFKIPETTMHSFEAKHNQIVWSLLVRGEIARWPDLAEVFAINVLPVRR
jgi:hypothetical protein